MAQGYRHDDVGAAKVHATADACHQIRPGLDLHTHVESLRRRHNVEPVVFCCVGPAADRRAIWDIASRRMKLFVDGRVSGNAIRLISVATESNRRYYARAIPKRKVATTPPAGGSSIQLATVAAGLMVTLFVSYLRGFPANRDVRLDLRVLTLGVSTHP